MAAWGLFSGGRVCLAQENNLFAYDSLYVSGDYSFILDSLKTSSDEIRLLKARTLAHLGEYQDAFRILGTLDSEAVEAAAYYGRYGNYDRAVGIAGQFARDSGFVGDIANYILAAHLNEADPRFINAALNLTHSPIELFKSVSALRLADYYYNNGVFDSAITALDAVDQLSLPPLYLADYHFLYCRIYTHQGNYNLALDNFENVLADNYMFDKTDKITSFALDSLFERLNYAQRVRMIAIFKRKGYYAEALGLFGFVDKIKTAVEPDSSPGSPEIDESDSLPMIKAWCYFGNRQYIQAADIFDSLADSPDSDLSSEAIYARAVCDYRRGLRLKGVEKLIEFADNYPNHSLAPRALFTAGDFYQRSNLAKAAALFKKLTDNYHHSRFYSRAMFLLARVYLEQGHYIQAKELFDSYPANDDFADLFDFWKYKIAQDDSSSLRRILDRRYASFYNIRARQELGLAAQDSVAAFDDFIAEFYGQAEDFLKWKVAKAPVDTTEIAYADSLFKYGLEYEAGFYLANIHNSEKNLYQDLAVLRKAYDLNLDWAFFKVLNDFKASLQRRGFSFSYESWQRLSYPVLFEDIVNYHAREAGIDPALAMSVIRRESRFNPLAVSNVGALGLMQLMIPTAAQMAGTRDLRAEMLFEPGYNVKLGCRYLHWLEVRLNKKEIVVAAYNAGPSAAKRWKRLAGNDIETYIEAIGYDQSRNYARWVIGDFYWYGNLWPTQFGN